MRDLYVWVLVSVLGGKERGGGEGANGSALAPVIRASYSRVSGGGGGATNPVDAAALALFDPAAPVADDGVVDDDDGCCGGVVVVAGVVGVVAVAVSPAALRDLTPLAPDGAVPVRSVAAPVFACAALAGAFVDDGDEDEGAVFAVAFAFDGDAAVVAGAIAASALLSVVFSSFFFSASRASSEG